MSRPATHPMALRVTALRIRHRFSSRPGLWCRSPDLLWLLSSDWGRLPPHTPGYAVAVDLPSHAPGYAVAADLPPHAPGCTIAAEMPRCVFGRLCTQGHFVLPGSAF